MNSNLKAAAGSWKTWLVLIALWAGAVVVSYLTVVDYPPAHHGANVVAWVALILLAVPALVSLAPLHSLTSEERKTLCLAASLIVAGMAVALFAQWYGRHHLDRNDISMTGATTVGMWFLARGLLVVIGFFGGWLGAFLGVCAASQIGWERWRTKLFASPAT